MGLGHFLMYERSEVHAVSLSSLFLKCPRNEDRLLVLSDNSFLLLVSFSFPWHLFDGPVIIINADPVVTYYGYYILVHGLPPKKSIAYIK